MKKGKTTKLNGYRTFKSHYGTIDAQNLKSIYVNLQTWVEPKEEVENWNRVVLNMSRSVKHSVLENINKETFDKCEYFSSFGSRVTTFLIGFPPEGFKAIEPLQFPAQSFIALPPQLPGPAQPVRFAA